MNRIFIRCEDKNEWERRTPVVPEDVKKISKEIPFIIEESKTRCIKKEDYIAAGCTISQSAGDAEVIAGIKEIPEEKILEDKIYVFFSHCVKGQKDGIHLLKTIMEKKGTLIDYEKITDEEGKRLIAFGKHAGYAGAVNALWLYGKRLKEKKISSSFSEFQQSIHYESVSHAKKVVEELGNKIQNEENIFEDKKPIVIGILGTGRVGTGALEIFECLGGKTIKPSELESVYTNSNTQKNQIYVCVFTLEDLLVRKDRKDYNRTDYQNNPNLYESKLEMYLPYISILANGLFWKDGNPNFLTWDMLERIYTSEKEPKLRLLSDITCDMYGTLECNIKYTSIMEPYYYIDPLNRCITDGDNPNAIGILAEENYPAEFSLDASRYFSSIAINLFENIAKADFTKPLEESGLLPEVKRAVISYHGELTKDFDYLKKYYE